MKKRTNSNDDLLDIDCFPGNVIKVVYNSKEYPNILRKLIRDIPNWPGDLDYSVKKATIKENYSSTLYIIIEIYPLYLELGKFGAWAMMKSNYGFSIEYNGKSYTVGGGELDEVKSKSMGGLLDKLEKKALKRINRSKY